MRNILRRSSSQPKQSWREEGGIVYFTFVSKGVPGITWAQQSKKRGGKVTESAEAVLQASGKASRKGKETRVALITVSALGIEVPHLSHALAEADMRKLIRPHAEAACHIADTFTARDLQAIGISRIVVMHDPLPDDLGNRCLIEVTKCSRRPMTIGALSLKSLTDGGGVMLDSKTAFAFAVRAVTH